MAAVSWSAAAKNQNTGYRLPITDYREGILKLITFEYENEVRPGVVWEDFVTDISSIAPDMLSLIDQGAAGLMAVVSLLQRVRGGIPLEDVRLLAPIPIPRRNIMCLGLNYVEHAEESYTAQGKDVTLPEVPIVFTKATTSVTGPYDPIPYVAAVSDKLDWEAELGVVIGRSGKNISEADALDYVFGYTVINDVSARDLQRQGKQYFKGKSLDGSCPTGPWIVTSADLPDPHSLRITSRVNGETKQDSNTNKMIFNIPATIAYLSRGMTLLPGDIISTGTPSGVGFARTPPEFLWPGDVVECEVEQIGTIRNEVENG
jgi:2-keto-4-pentenoate hydratase/2-oxohepta-3-ene-1,7-dioic acid hydratase in catechol pathway